VDVLTVAAAKKPAPRKDNPLADLYAILDRARGLDAKGEVREALKCLEQAPPDVRSVGMYHYARGSLLARSGDIPGAVAAFREAVRLDPEVPEYAANLGAALVATYRRQKDDAALEEAIAVLERAAASGPKMPIVHGNLGFALEAAGRLEEALVAYDGALELDATFADARRARDALAAKLGR
jgi:Flp pilus assembly protein TadD